MRDFELASDGYFVFDEKRHELCKCHDGRTASSDWRHHKKYCPIWKNGRIAGLESELKELREKLSEMYCPNAHGFEGPETFSDCGKCVVCESKELLKQ